MIAVISKGNQDGIAKITWDIIIESVGKIRNILSLSAATLGLLCVGVLIIEMQLQPEHKSPGHGLILMYATRF